MVQMCTKGLLRGRLLLLLMLLRGVAGLVRVWPLVLPQVLLLVLLLPVWVLVLLPARMPVPVELRLKLLVGLQRHNTQAMNGPLVISSAACSVTDRETWMAHQHPRSRPLTQAR